MPIPAMDRERHPASRQLQTTGALGFKGELRRHFLHWRAIGSTERDELFGQARLAFAALDSNVAGGQQ